MGNMFPYFSPAAAQGADPRCELKIPETAQVAE